MPSSHTGGSSQPGVTWVGKPVREAAGGSRVMEGMAMKRPRSPWFYRSILPLAAIFGLGATVLPVSASGTDVRLNVANPSIPFATDKSAEAAIAINPANPEMVAAGAFDEVDEAPCGTAQS